MHVFLRRYNKKKKLKKCLKIKTKCWAWKTLSLRGKMLADSEEYGNEYCNKRILYIKCYFWIFPFFLELIKFWKMRVILNVKQTILYFNHNHLKQIDFLEKSLIIQCSLISRDIARQLLMFSKLRWFIEGIQGLLQSEIILFYRYLYRTGISLNTLSPKCTFVAYFLFQLSDPYCQKFNHTIWK